MFSFGIATQDWVGQGRRLGRGRFGLVGSGLVRRFRIGAHGFGWVWRGWAVLDGQFQVCRGAVGFGKVWRLSSGNTGWAGHGPDRRLRIGPIWTGAVRRGRAWLVMAVPVWSGTA